MALGNYLLGFCFVLFLRTCYFYPLPPQLPPSHIQKQDIHLWMPSVIRVYIYFGDKLRWHKIQNWQSQRIKLEVDQLYIKGPPEEVWYPGASISRAATTLRPWPVVAWSQEEKSLPWVEQGPVGEGYSQPTTTRWTGSKGNGHLTSHSPLSCFLLGLPIGQHYPEARVAENCWCSPRCLHLCAIDIWGYRSFCCKEYSCEP